MAGDEQEPYPFEVEVFDARTLPRSRRTHDDAVRALAVLRRRLDIAAEAKLDHDFERTLLRYCTDLVLNITWYERARRREESRNSRMTALMVALMFVALGLLIASSMLPMRSGGIGAQSGMLQLTLFAGAALTVLQVIAGLGDGKARMTIFWKASADLKEALYSFERGWRGKSVVLLGGGAVGPAPGFDDALEDVLRLSRGITRAERLDFFATLRSPSDVVAIATAAADAFRGRRGDVAAVFAKHDDGVADAARAATEARAAVAASEFRLGALTDAVAKKAEEKTLLDARAEVVRTEKVLRELSSV